jgi:hypothetical protein
MWTVAEAVMSFTREAKVRDIPLSDPGPSKRSKILDSTNGVVAASRTIKRACSRDAIKATLRWILNVGLVLSIGLTGLSHTAAAASSERSLAITIHVHNYAGVAPETLRESEEVTTEIFRAAGAETQWVVIVPTTRDNPVNSADYPAFTSADFQLSILPSKMSDRFGIPNNVIGLAPGTDAQIVYVFASKVETLFWRLLRAQCSGRMDRPVSRAQILGHVIAHELGHLLLNMNGHSAHGIMRGDLDFTDRHDSLLFTPQQAEVLRADVRRRSGQPEMLAHAD